MALAHRRRSRRGVEARPTVAQLLDVERLEHRCLLSAAPTDPEQNNILVRFDAGAPPQVVAGTAIIGTFELVADLYEIEVDASLTTEQAIAAYSALDSVQYAVSAYMDIQAIPNDPLYPQMYAMNNTGQTGGTVDADIDAQEAWDIHRGSRSVIVAVIDSGIDYGHPDLAANIWHNPDEVAGNNIDDDGNGFVDDALGWDFFDDDNNPLDQNGHGTHVAGTIGAVGNNGIGVAGVAWEVSLMALKIGGAGPSVSVAGAIRAVSYAINEGATILNNSWGGPGFNAALNDIITAAQNAGVIFVAAAGNDAQNNDVLSNFPSNYIQDNVVAVAATDDDDQLANFSSFGRVNVDIAAPGVNILSTWPRHLPVQGQPAGFNVISGTSMATPTVSGALAVIWAANPTLTYREVIDRLYSTGDLLPQLVNVTSTGKRINLHRALTTTSSQPVGPFVQSVEWTGSTTQVTKARVTFNENLLLSSVQNGDFVLKRPDGVLVATNVTQVGGSLSVFDVTFAAQVTPGTYTLTIGPNLQDAFLNFMDQDQDTAQGETLQDQFISSFVIPQPDPVFQINTSITIPDAATIRVPIFINHPTLFIEDLNVRVNIAHTNDSDLKLTLIAPNGQRLVLMNRRGGTGDNIQAIFDDEAARSITVGQAPFLGAFKPEQALSTFENRLAKGTWSLEIQDFARNSQSGRLLHFSLTIKPAAGSFSVGTSAARLPELIQLNGVTSPAETLVEKKVEIRQAVTEVRASVQSAVDQTSDRARSVVEQLDELPDRLRKGKTSSLSPIHVDGAFAAFEKLLAR